MPNYVKNRLTISSRVGEVLAFVKGEGTIFDFNKILPMPRELDIQDSSVGDLGMEYLLLKARGSFFHSNRVKDLEEQMNQGGYFEEGVELGKKFLINIANTGYKTWYYWCINNWGTKWNAIEPSMISDNCVEFDTAWSGVPELIEKLSKQFPEVEFQYKYADEDTGHNCVHGVVLNGISNMVSPAPKSREAYELAFELRPAHAEYYSLINGEYVYQEEE